ncbi:MAG TPA: 3-hydroxyacyl-CoA dehydrogenase family protein [Chitinophagaceae bacterium]|nr:3-hydroxyacyl-CoA dehydrogenase family protein [Chitinophagaceae bacterium]
MHVIVVTGENQQQELIPKRTTDRVDFVTTLRNKNPSHLIDAIIDLGFQPEDERISQLQQYQPGVVIVNSVISTLDQFPDGFVRINGWPGFLRGPLIEASASNEDAKKLAGEIFSLFEKSIEWVPDIMGFISPRILSMIINEAYYALQEGVSGKAEIDTAMKLGTNYPYGPFEWAGKIGLNNIADLLSNLSATIPRYQPAELLLKESISR